MLGLCFAMGEMDCEGGNQRTSTLKGDTARLELVGAAAVVAVDEAH
jgi:hypothetical protein